MPTEESTTRLIRKTLGSRSLNEYPEAPRHDQLLRRALRRRRVTLKPVGEHSQVFVFGGVVVGGMDSVVTTLVSAHARRIVADPLLLRRHLELQEVPLPAEPVEGAESTQPVESVESEDSTQSVPPTELSAPTDAEELAAPSTVRAFVVGERVSASLLRLPATVLGDGSSTLEQLLHADARARSRHALLSSTALPSTSEASAPAAREKLRQRGLDPEEVPTEGALVRLQDSLAISAGGLSIDVTTTLPDALHELAVDAVMAVPGLFAAAVDLQVPDLESTEGAVVLAVLPDADISLAHLPGYGEPRDVAGAIAEEILLRASR
ncbi:hypothetical protein I2485_05210 [Nesterenkonia sp. E16_7]|uniref:hypothetical protein n=1 Tax=unclassified Nesterenkonia TaxID=2629769 RepID=UPI001A90D33D|nr:MULTISPECIES: hypothetical protein [unclassified Nesterenkonia]MBO0595302.1 hypothetical protein [Nesterenkonia sp. E16_10]MBO0598045.1 hypothetical protein [Nesterenkonia sp. E16_7]